MSKIEVDTIAPQSGTQVTLGESGDTITIPAGATFDASSGTLTLADGSVTNAKLANSSITINGSSVSLGGSTTIETGTSWQSDIKTSAFTAVAGEGYWINTTSAVITVTLPASASVGDTIEFSDYLRTWGTNAVTLNTNSLNFQGNSSPNPEYNTSGQGFAKSLKMDCTTAQGSLATGDRLLIQQRIEGQNLQYLKKGTSSAESTTISFWVKSAKTGTYIAELYDGDNSRQISKSYTISSADTWEKKTLTYAGDTTGALDNDNGTSLILQFWLASGTDYTSGTLSTSWSSITNANRAVGQVNLADSTSNDWYVTAVQLEAGTTASEFEFLPYDVNLQRCLRYFWQIQGVSGANITLGMGFSNSSTNNITYLKFPTTMRTSPSVTGTGLEVSDGNSYTQAVTVISVGQTNGYQTQLNATVASGLTVLRPGYTQLAGSTSNYLALSSEL